MPPTKRRAIALDVKLDVLSAIDREEKFTAIAARFGMSLSNIYNIDRYREEILEAAKVAVDAVERHRDLIESLLAEESGRRLSEKELEKFFALADSRDESGKPRSFSELAAAFGLSLQETQDLYSCRHPSRRPQTFCEDSELLLPENCGNPLPAPVPTSKTVTRCEPLIITPPTPRQAVRRAANASLESAVSPKRIYTTSFPASVSDESFTAYLFALDEERMKQKLLQVCLSY